MPRLISKLLTRAETRGLDLDDPRTTGLRRQIIASNRFLWRIYDEWYRMISSSVPSGEGKALELGSGAGFLGEYVPGLIASEVFSCPGINVVLDAQRMPFRSGSLKAIALLDVFHHIPDSRSFLREAARSLRPGGAVLMIEPWVSTWSRLIYANLHHEPFDPGAKEWSFPSTGPLSGANIALPWIVFERDREDFERVFPEFRIRAVRPFMPLRYLVSGGVSMRQLMPERMHPMWRRVEGWLGAWPQHWSMFAFIHLERR
jgi:SAM-dependent methyltransferase